MKKMYAVLLTLALATAVVMPNFAASSPSIDEEVSSTTDDTDTTTSDTEEEIAPPSAVEITVPNLTISSLYSDVKKEVASVVSTPQVLIDLSVPLTARLVSSFDAYYDGVVPAGGIIVPIEVLTAKQGDYAYVLHRSSVTGTWEKIGEGFLGADLTVMATFTDFSPVAVMIVDAAEVDSVVKSPKTGQ